MLRQTKALFLLSISFVLAGCLLFPSEDLYDGGFAWVGSDLYLYAPMCEGEQLIGVEVYDVEENREDPDNPVITNLWVVNGPIGEMTKNGWVILADNDSFNTTSTSVTRTDDWPLIVGISLTQEDEKGKFSSSFVLETSDEIPRYGAEADPLTVEYLFGNPSHRTNGELLTPGQMRDKTGCAKDYF